MSKSTKKELEYLEDMISSSQKKQKEILDESFDQINQFILDFEDSISEIKRWHLNECSQLKLLKEDSQIKYFESQLKEIKSFWLEWK